MIIVAQSRSRLTTNNPIHWDGVDEGASDLGIDDVWNSQYYECRLEAADERIDYLLALPRGAAAAAASRLGTSTCAFAPDRRAAWTPIVSLLESWADGRSLLSVRSPTVWLEFDDPRLAAPTPPVPSVSVCLVPDYRHDRPPLPSDVGQDLQLVRDVLTTLRPGAAAPLDAELSQCFDRLPSGAQWIHLSVMLGRASRDVKLYGRCSREQLLPYLRDVGWSGSLTAIEDAMDRLYSPALVGNEIFIDLNLANFRDPMTCSLGLAVSQQQLVSGPDSDPARTPVLDALVASGLCAPEKAAALKAWPTDGIQIESRGPWGLRTMRFLDLKLVWQSGFGLHAKAYLGSRRWQSMF